nr:hypothetical protein KPHV_03510 [Kitasatospora purpeofusca]
MGGVGAARRGIRAGSRRERGSALSHCRPGRPPGQEAPPCLPGCLFSLTVRIEFHKLRDARRDNGSTIRDPADAFTFSSGTDKCVAVRVQARGKEPFEWVW